MLPPLRRFELTEFLLSLPDMPEFLLSELRSGKEASTGGLSEVRRPLMLASDWVAEVRDMLLLEDATLAIAPSSRSSLEARDAEPHLLKPSPLLLLLLLPWRGCTYCTSWPTFGWIFLAMISCPGGAYKTPGPRVGQFHHCACGQPFKSQ